MMRLIRRPVVFCAIVIFINLSVFIFVKYQLQTTSVNLTYKIYDINMKEGRLFVQLDIQKVNTNKLILDSGLPAELQGLEIRSVQDSIGKSINYTHVVDPVEKRKNVDYSESKLVIPLNRRQNHVRIVYKVSIGLNNPTLNSMVKVKKSFPIMGTMSDEFALFSGRNVLLLPRTEIDQVKIEIEPQKQWDIISTLQNTDNPGEFSLVSKRPKLALFGAVIGLGRFTEFSKQMNQTTVKLYVNEGHRPHQEKIADTAFSIFQSINDLFGATAEHYTFVFTPIQQDGDKVWMVSNSMGVGAVLSKNPTETQWMDIARHIFYKWNKYSEDNLSYTQQDQWFVDGSSIYTSIQILSKQDVLNKDRWLLKYYSDYYSLYPYSQLPNQYFYHSEPSLHLDLVNPDETQKPTYWTTNNSKGKERRAKSVVFTAYLDNWISEQSQGKYDLNDIIKHRYKTRIKSRSLIDDVQVVANLDATTCFAYAHGDALPIPNKHIRSIGELEKIPQHLKKDLDTSETGPILETTGEETSSDWNNERTLTFLISSNTQTYLETCGCLGNQSGGVARMATVVRQEREKNPNLMLFSAGNAFPNKRAEGYIDELELTAFLDCFDMMDYEFAALSELEFLYGYDKLKKHTAPLSFPFICSNIYDGNHPIFEPYILKKIGNYNIGFLGLSQAVYSSSYMSMYQYNTSELSINHPIKIIDRYLPKLRELCDLVVLVGRLDIAMITDILDHTDEIDVIITPLSLSEWSVNSSGEIFTGRSAQGFIGDTLIWVCHGKTYALDKLELNLSSSGKVQDYRHSKIELSESVEDAPNIKSYLNEFYAKVAENEKVAFEKPILSWEGTNAKFVGVEKCKSCHLEEYKQWSQTKHATAFNTLIQKHRQFSPKCVMCHVTGGGYDSGFTFGTSDRSLVDVQCEMCHGPGSTHIVNPLQVNMLRRPTEKLCITCHDDEHSNFDMKKYYHKVKH